MQKIKSIEGIRAIGWIGIYASHYRSALLPNAKWPINRLPFIHFLNSSGQVYMFFIISGIVLSLKYFTRECWNDALKDIIRRYFRLMVPILVAELAVYCLMCGGFLYNLKAAYILGNEGYLGIFNDFQPNLLSCLLESSFGVFLLQSSKYIGPLWMMTYEFLGSLLVIAALSILKKSKWRWLFYTVFLLAYKGYYSLFIVGMMIADLYVNVLDDIRWSSSVWTTVSMIGYLVMSTVYFVRTEEDQILLYVFYFGCVVFFIGMMRSSVLEKLLGNTRMEKIGGLSFSAFLLHWPIIESFTCWCFIKLYYMEKWNQWTNMGLFFVSLILVAGLASVFKRKVEPLGSVISDKLLTVFSIS